MRSHQMPQDRHLYKQFGLCLESDSPLRLHGFVRTLSREFRWWCDESEYFLHYCEAMGTSRRAKRLLSALDSIAISASALFGLAACLDIEGEPEAEAPLWDGPTNGVWGTDISPAAFLLPFGDTWDINTDVTVSVEGIPTFGPLIANQVEVTGPFSVTRTRESNGSIDHHFGWVAGNDEPSEVGNSVRVECDDEDLQVGESTICYASFKATPDQIENFSWRLGMHDAAAWPGQTVESAPTS